VVPFSFAFRAGVAQLVEQLIRNQQVRGSSPRAGSKFPGKLHRFGVGFHRDRDLTHYLTHYPRIASI
jgi:hypothetical protein